MKKAIIGRDKEIEWMWRILADQSVVLASLRRIGKTSVLKKMARQPRKSWQAVYYPVQGKVSVEEFVQGLYSTLIEEEVIEARTRRVLDFYEKFFAGQTIKGFELPELKRHWKDILTRILEAIAEKKKKVVIMLDEFPWMLYQLVTKHKRESQAMELLDIMRTLRERLESESNIRFVFCGSIGFNILLNYLVRQHDYLGNPTNNMYTQILEEMTPKDALTLCKHLGEIHKIKDSKPSAFNHIVRETQRLPFYIDLIFTELAKQGHKTASKPQVDKIVKNIVLDVSGNGHFDHFRERVDSYYLEGQKELAYAILKWMSTQEKAVSRQELFKVLQHIHPVKEDSLAQTLKDLTRDLYIVMDDDLKYSFRYHLLQRWWRVHYA